MKNEILCTECGQLVDKEQKWYWMEDKCYCEQCMVDKYPDLSDTFERKTKNCHKRP